MFVAMQLFGRMRLYNWTMHECIHAGWKYITSYRLLQVCPRLLMCCVVCSFIGSFVLQIVSMFLRASTCVRLLVQTLTCSFSSRFTNMQYFSLGLYTMLNVIPCNELRYEYFLVVSRHLGFLTVACVTQYKELSN